MTGGPHFIGGPIWTHDKRGGDVIVAGVREFKGTLFLDIRVWANGGKTATPKGATIALDEIAGFARALGAYVATTAAVGREDGS